LKNSVLQFIVVSPMWPTFSLLSNFRGFLDTVMGIAISLRNNSNENFRITSKDDHWDCYIKQLEGQETRRGCLERYYMQSGTENITREVERTRPSFSPPRESGLFSPGRTDVPSTSRRDWPLNDETVILWNQRPVSYIFFKETETLSLCEKDTFLWMSGCRIKNARMLPSHKITEKFVKQFRFCGFVVFKPYKKKKL